MIDALFAAPAAWVDRDEDGIKEDLRAHRWTPPPGGVMPGTRTYQNKRLWHVQLPDDADLNTIKSLIPGQCLGALGAEIPATYDDEGVELTPRSRVEVVPLHASLVNYLQDVVTYDEDGNEVSRTRPTQWSPPHMFAGNDW